MVYQGPKPKVQILQCFVSFESFLCQNDRQDANFSCDAKKSNLKLYPKKTPKKGVAPVHQIQY